MGAAFTAGSTSSIRRRSTTSWCADASPRRPNPGDPRSAPARRHLRGSV